MIYNSKIDHQKKDHKGREIFQALYSASYYKNTTVGTFPELKDLAVISFGVIVNPLEGNPRRSLKFTKSGNRNGLMVKILPMWILMNFMVSMCSSPKILS